MERNSSNFVICINTGGNDALTVEGRYEVLEENEKSIKIVNDKRIANWYFKSLFGTELKKEVKEFSTGAKRDLDGKEDYVETISWLALKRYAEYMTAKAAIYGRGNWRKGIPIESYEQSLMRHLQKYLANKYDNANLEPEEDHLSAACFNLLGLIHEEEKLKLKK